MPIDAYMRGRIGSDSSDNFIVASSIPVAPFANMV